MIDRIIRAIRLDRKLFREVAADEGYLSEAVIIVVAVAVLSGAGAAVTANQAVLAFFIEMMNSLVLGWLLWSALAYLIGSRLGGRSSVLEMARTLGFASAPRLISLFGFVPCVGWVFLLAGWGLGIAAGVIAIRESMEFDTRRALITAGLGLLLYILVRIALGIITGGLSLVGIGF